MKNSKNLIIILGCSLLILAILAGILIKGNHKKEAVRSNVEASTPTTETGDAKNLNEPGDAATYYNSDKPENSMVEAADNADSETPETVKDMTGTSSDPDGYSDNGETPDNAGDNTNENSAEVETVKDEINPEKYEIIWLGDSLTQGSLGDDNHNENNPQAPWRVLKEISGRNVAGCGFFGYTAHDIFWTYGEYNGVKDPGIIYVYWVGSNDFHESPDNIKYVIEEIDRFNNNVGISRFLVLGTTNRHDMDPNAYIPINQCFAEYYGEKYLDIMPYVEFGDDGVHLTADSYHKVAEAVYAKLKELYL